MKIDTEERHGAVREGYQLLMRARAELLLPSDHAKIRHFYERLCEACMTWAIEVHGERLRRDFSELEEIREKSRFRAQSYCFRMRIPWEKEAYAVFLCESVLDGHQNRADNSYRRMSHVWDLSEETMLPLEQVMRMFGVKIKKDMLPFRPDGIYPESGCLVLFRNATRTSPFLEKRFEIETDGKNSFL